MSLIRQILFFGLDKDPMGRYNEVAKTISKMFERMIMETFKKSKDENDRTLLLYELVNQPIYTC